MGKSLDTKSSKKTEASLIKIKEENFLKFVQKNKVLQGMNLKFVPFAHTDHYLAQQQVPNSTKAVLPSTKAKKVGTISLLPALKIKVMDKLSLVGDAYRLPQSLSTLRALEKPIFQSMNRGM
jgi:hypothetical protein